MVVMNMVVMVFIKLKKHDYIDRTRGNMGLV